MIVDLHVHTDATESGRNVPEIVGALASSGLDAVALTDVGVISSPADVAGTFEEAGLSVFFGVELPTETGRWLLYPPNAIEAAESKPWGEPGSDGLYSSGVVETLTGQGWAAVLVQPFLNDGAGEGVYALQGMHAIQITQGEEPLSARDLAMEAGLALDIPLVAGSNLLGDLEALGKVGTVLLRAASTQSEFVRELKEGHMFVAKMGTPKVTPEARRRKRGPRRRRSRSSKAANQDA